jgi:biotin carboxyl carrier protein
MTHIRIGDHVLRVEPDGAAFRVTDGAAAPALVAADVSQLAPGVLSILVNGRSYEARLDSSPTGDAIVLNGHRYPFTVEDPRSLRARRASSAGHDGPRTIHSPMPGRILRILHSPGDAIAANAGVLVVEAMKMQNELKSPKAGTLRKVLVAVGDTVTAGQALAIID